MRLGGRRDDGGFDAPAVPGAVGNGAEYRQIFDRRRRGCIEGAMVVEESDGPQPQLWHVLQ
ncbi:MAG: hypothetical protein ACREH3_13530, partial [Geminicoccales bacterium]